jgi:hypothetical protein
MRQRPDIGSGLAQQLPQCCVGVVDSELIRGYELSRRACSCRLLVTCGYKCLIDVGRLRPPSHAWCPATMLRCALRCAAQ